MLSRVASAVTTAVAVLWSAGAHAADVESFDLDDGLTAIFISGEIREGDADKFRREAAKHEDAFVVLESNGGSTLEAIQIGEAIRLRGFSTLVLNDTQCVSACGLIWLAGTPRSLSQSGRVGFHATYTDESGQPLESGVGNALVGRYFTLLNLPTKAIIFATEAAPNSLNWLDRSNTEEAGIEVKFIDDWDWSKSESSAAKPSPPPVVSPPPIVVQRVQSNAPTEKWEDVGPWSVMVDHTLGDSCFLASVFNDGTLLRLGFDRTDGGDNYILMSNARWASLTKGETQRIEFKLGEASPWQADMKVIDFGGSATLHTRFSDTKFWVEFASSKSMSITHDSRQVALLTFEDTAAAYASMNQCQEHYNQQWDGRDPFSN